VIQGVLVLILCYSYDLKKSLQNSVICIKYTLNYVFTYTLFLTTYLSEVHYFLFCVDFRQRWQPYPTELARNESKKYSLSLHFPRASRRERLTERERAKH